MDQPKMILLRLSVALCLILTLAACAIGKPVTRATTYVIEIPPPAVSVSRRPETLTMGRVRVAPAFASRSLVVRLDEVRYSADFDNTLISEPGELLGSRIASWLDQAGVFASVTQPGDFKGARHVLEAVVTELYGDMRPGRTPTAVVKIQFRLLDLTGVTPKVILEQTIGRRAALSDASPQALVRGYGSALGEILNELVTALSPT